MNFRKAFVIFSIIAPTLILVLTFYTHHDFSWLLIPVIPIILIGYYDMLQKKHSITRNFPVIGRLRFLMESVRPEVIQYFVEQDTEGAPINRMFRSIVYQRAKKSLDTNPYGTKVDVYRIGYEWMSHSIYAKSVNEINQNPRILIGSKQCKKPYSANIFNISAMSFGALSKNAIMALNKGAKMGNFYHNTGEGGLSEYHKKYGGDLVFQFGTGYFGCRTKDGKFSPEKFEEVANLEQVKMIEIKLSQGAKPGHGGFLPAEKNTPEIAKIRGIEPFVDIISPPRHTAFSNSYQLMEFIQNLRELSKGKPVGFKICIGEKKEFIDICKAIIETGIYPDFITVDGGEGGTGAAPLEFSNSLGMPYKDSVVFVHDTLLEFGLKDEIKIIASGKILTGFHIAKALALGADLCNSARGMMLALGCIHALKCHTNRCPVGVATQDEVLTKGLVIDEKAERVKNYQQQTVKSFVEILAAAGLERPEQIRRKHLFRRVSSEKIKNFEEIYPYPKINFSWLKIFSFVIYY